MDTLGIDNAHLVGIIGIGACIFQEVAIARPDLVKTMVNRRKKNAKFTRII